MKSIFLGGGLAGVVLFIWGAVAHMLLPLGNMGMQELPHSTSVTYALDLALDGPGLYVFPWMDDTKGMSKEALAEWEADYRDGPVGMILYRPTGGDPMATRLFITQALTDLAAGFIAAILLYFTRLGFVGRLLFATSLGLLAWIVSALPQWNWYGFPGEMILASGVEMVVGWFLAGLVLAAVGGSKASADD